MNISISPSNTFSSNKILVQPMVPGDLWLLNLSSGAIHSGIAHSKLDREEDDQGLYLRTRIILDNYKFMDYVKQFGAKSLLFGCAKHQVEAPGCANRLYIYDLIGSTRPINIHLCNKSCANASLLRPPYKVLHSGGIELLFERRDELLFQWGSVFPRPLIMRDFDADRPYYVVADRFLQWSPPKFWHDMGSMDRFPVNTEGWVSDLLSSFNWDYFRTALEAGSISPDQVAATIFDILYKDYIYFSICRKLWGQPESGEDRPYSADILSQVRPQVLINYTDIVDRIHDALRRYANAGQEEPLAVPDETDDLAQLDIDNILRGIDL